jgi:hypothetical protein
MGFPGEPRLLACQIGAQENRVSQEPVGCPGQIGDLGNKLRLNPMHAGENERRVAAAEMQKVESIVDEPNSTLAVARRLSLRSLAIHRLRRRIVRRRDRRFSPEHSRGRQ